MQVPSNQPSNHPSALGSTTPVKKKKSAIPEIPTPNANYAMDSFWTSIAGIGRSYSQITCRKKKLSKPMIQKTDDFLLVFIPIIAFSRVSRCITFAIYFWDSEAEDA